MDLEQQLQRAQRRLEQYAEIVSPGTMVLSIEESYDQVTWATIWTSGRLEVTSPTISFSLFPSLPWKEGVTRHYTIKVYPAVLDAE